MANVKSDRKMDWKRLVIIIFLLIFQIALVFLRVKTFDDLHKKESNQKVEKTNVELVLTTSDVGQADRFLFE